MIFARLYLTSQVISLNLSIKLSFELAEPRFVEYVCHSFDQFTPIKQSSKLKALTH